jgi:hypothetical protein
VEVVGVVVTAASGFDLEYAWRGQAAGVERTAGGYYMNAAQAGEAPGRWFGAGAAALGLAEGLQVERSVYGAVFDQKHPVTGEQLGRRRAAGNSYRLHLAGLLAAEPHATAERKLELQREAARLTRQTAPYTDVTVSFSKSISVLHASIRENARRARQVGDQALAGWWDAREQEFQDVLQAANRAALRHAETWAGLTRTGNHAGRVDGQETGRFEQARIAVASWLQFTSRDGDPQDHIHNQVARMVQTISDGKWRALDTVALRGQLPAMQAVAATFAECELSRRFGVSWVPRPDGAGNEVAGITQAQMDAYSSRRDAINDALGPAVCAWEEKYGRAPNQRELLHIKQAVTMATRKPKARTSDLDKDNEPGALYDWDEMAARWDAQLSEPLAAIAHAVSTLSPCKEPAPREPAAQLSAQACAHAAQIALAQVQAAHSTWTRADLLKQLALAMPAESRAIHPDTALALLHSLADRAVAGEFEDVVCLDAPEWLAVPDSLRRPLDGTSVYTRPGTERYATRCQLSMEERLLDRAQGLGAPCRPREDAARMLGATTAMLDAQLRAHAQDARATLTACGLRADQAAALFAALTSARVTEVLIGPAGSGKTAAAACAARMWAQAGGAVYGTATSQAARNVLAAGGVELAENTAVFLGHQPGRRGARGIRDLTPGTLIIADESSMTSVADLADMCTFAAARGCKLLIIGDNEQLAAVEGGGGMALLAARLGCVQLAEAVRFTAEWEQDASLRLRYGEISALEDYDAHGRIRGGGPEEAMEEARRLYVAQYVTGSDVELIAWERERCREMSRRIRDDLQHLGLVDRGREVQIADGARASRGDMIIARANDHRIGVANGDTLRIEAINDDGSLTVRHRRDRDPGTGRRQWASGTFRYRAYRTADLAYACTAHTAQGRTVTASITLATGGETRQWLYSAMTRATMLNIVCAFTIPVKLSDPKPGTRPAPELARQEGVSAERSGLPVPEAAKQGEPRARERLAVLADVLARDGAEMSALEIQRRNLANADHLARLDAMWRDIVGRIEKDRYRHVFRELLPSSAAADLEASYRAPWLWRTLRAAEVAGLDARDVAAEAVCDRPLDGARDIAAVIDARIRQATGALPPESWRPWADRVPEVGDPQTQAFLHDLAAAMDDRRQRIGEHTAEAVPDWAISALGPVPPNPVDRLEWEHRAGHIGAYRELYGWDHHAEPCGPEPSGDSPEKRASWQAAYAAMTRTESLDLRGEPDGRLWHMRASYQAETAWAPPYVAEELRAIRTAIIDTAATVTRAGAESLAARARGDDEVASRHEAISASAVALGNFYRLREEIDAGLMEDYRAWSRVTEGSRRVAVLADAELRRRHADLELDPLRSTEPPALAPDTPAPPADPAEVNALAAQARRQREAFREQLEVRQGVQIPAEDPDHVPEGEAWPTAWPQRHRDAVLQPPKPEIRPALEVERAADTEIEATI